MSRLARDTGAAPIQCLRPAITESFAVSGTAAASSAVTQRVVRIMCDVDCFYTADGSTAAVGTAVPLPASTIEFIHTYVGDTISVITSSGSGTFYVTEMV